MVHQAQSFPPIVAPDARVLILGSMPGIKSLAARQYYAHSQNAFWKIMSDLFNAPVDSYVACKRLIISNHLALWDVLKYCEREGSLDAAIRDDTMIVNDFTAFLQKHKTITHIFFNGAKAAQVLKKYALPKLPPESAARISMAQLPSTSPAHAGMNFAEKRKQWSIICSLAGGESISRLSNNNRRR